jgi:hypothetical protein
MRRSAVCSFLTVTALAVGWPSPSAVQAQPAPPLRGTPGYPGPAVSPYLNLLRQGSSAGVNYYGIVRPEIEFRNSIQNLQQQVSTVGSEVTAQDQSLAGLPPTGHPVQFMNYSHYFGGSLRNPGATSGARAPGRATASAAPTTGSQGATAPRAPTR